MNWLFCLYQIPTDIDVDCEVIKKTEEEREKLEIIGFKIAGDKTANVD